MNMHDALQYLPSTRILHYPAGIAVYEAMRVPSDLYLVVAGRVKIIRTAENGSQTLLRVVGPEELFGEFSLVPNDHAFRQSAVAKEATKVFFWSAEQVEERIQREPKLGLALFNYFGREIMRMRDRLTVIAKYGTGQRVRLSLIQLARTNGSTTSYGARRITGFTHQAIADYVGTSREIVTCELNYLRRLGYVSYSRVYIDVYTSALCEWIRQQGVSVYERAGQVASGGITARAS
jgi:CRP/FNR family transcriptional regulator, cyclic AMP receptor protein